MTEYIEREAAIKAIDEALKRVFVTPIGTDIMRNVPAADVVPVVHGRWVVKYDIWGKNVKTLEGYKCSKCGGFSCYQDNYCAYCGAKMDGEEEEVKPLEDPSHPFVDSVMMED